MNRKAKKMKIMNTVKLTVEFIREGKAIIAHCPSLDLSAYGDSIESAKIAFGKTFKLFVEELQKMGTLEDVLAESGWKKATSGSGKDRKTWNPPEYIGNLNEEFAIPV